jgi:hypothetical protein
VTGPAIPATQSRRVNTCVWPPECSLGQRLLTTLLVLLEELLELLAALLANLLAERGSLLLELLLPGVEPRLE